MLDASVTPGDSGVSPPAGPSLELTRTAVVPVGSSTSRQVDTPSALSEWSAPSTVTSARAAPRITTARRPPPDSWTSAKLLTARRPRRSTASRISSIGAPPRISDQHCNTIGSDGSMSASSHPDSAPTATQVPGV
jgi:hypothetical protein